MKRNLLSCCKEHAGFPPTHLVYWQNLRLQQKRTLRTKTMARSNKNTSAKPIKPPSTGGACSEGPAPTYSGAFGGARNPTRARSKLTGAGFYLGIGISNALVKPAKKWKNILEELRKQVKYKSQHTNHIVMLKIITQQLVEIHLLKMTVGTIEQKDKI